MEHTNLNLFEVTLTFVQKRSYDTIILVIHFQVGRNPSVRKSSQTCPDVIFQYQRIASSQSRKQ